MLYVVCVFHVCVCASVYHSTQISILSPHPTLSHHPLFSHHHHLSYHTLFSQSHITPPSHITPHPLTSHPTLSHHTPPSHITPHPLTSHPTLSHHTPPSITQSQNSHQVVPALDPSTPIFAAGFSMQLIKRRMQEFNIWTEDRFHVFGMRERFNAGPFRCGGGGGMGYGLGMKRDVGLDGGGGMKRDVLSFFSSLFCLS